jgi:xylulokinase
MTPYLGIDLGTSATKTVLIDETGTVLARGRFPHLTSRAGHPGRVEVLSWVTSIGEAVRQLGGIRQSATAIGLSVHCPTLIALDASGKPVTDGLTWDHEQFPEYIRRADELRTTEERAAAGNRTSPATFVAAGWPLLCDLEPEATQQTHKIGLVGTWLGAELTGEFALDPTQASYTGIFGTTREEPAWLMDLAERIGVPVSLLPTIRPSLSQLGRLREDVAERFGVRPGIPVMVGSADTPAANFALGNGVDDDPMFIMGTTHVISSRCPSPDPNAVALQRVDVSGTNHLVNGVISGGDSLAVGAQLLGYGSGNDAVPQLIRTAAQAQPSDLRRAPVFIPHVVPERGPLWFTTPRTALIGMLPSTTPQQAALGVVLGVLLADRIIIDACVPGGENDRAIVMTGAFDNDPLLPQLFADVLGRRIRVVTEGYLPAIGAAAAALYVVEGATITPPSAIEFQPRSDWSAAIQSVWPYYVQIWQAVTEHELPKPASCASRAVSERH